MYGKEDVRAFLLEYVKQYPRLEIDDLIKLLYQSAFGCGHFAPGEARVLAFLEEETAGLNREREWPLVERVLGGYARVHLAPYVSQGMRLLTLSRLFMRTASEPPREDAGAWFAAALDLLEGMAQEEKLPFDADAVKARLAAYRAAGCPAIHHSETFRAAYRPAYRIVRAEYAQLLELFARIDGLLDQKERVLIAIDGNSGAGKSTLAQLMAAVYPELTLVHMDDFFLQLHQRTPERFALPGGNVDHERFLSEVLLPMRAGEAFCYRPFDCARMAIGEGRQIVPGKLCVTEGSYSLHPALESAYDLKVLLRISPAAQAERILKRNGPQMLGRFMNEWIPMENRYFEATEVADRCDVILDVRPQARGVSYTIEKTEERA